MSSSHLPFFFLVLFSFLQRATSGITCRDTCDPTQSEPSIRFPFRRVDQSSWCGYEGFELSCDNKNQTILSLPKSGNFIVQKIDYLSQTISINDPNSCLPRRLVKSFKLTDTPFERGDHVVYKFLKCPSNNVPTNPWSRVINCMSGDDFTVVAVPEYRYNQSEPLRTRCHRLGRVEVPVLWPSWSELENGVLLSWNLPVCQSCEEQGRSCGFKNDVSDSVPRVGCDNLRSNGLPRSAKYGIIIGVAIPGLLCFIGIACYLCGRATDYYHRHRGHSGTEFVTTITPQSVIIIAGLDKTTIESFPKTLLGESKRLPKPNDNICAICLCEYQPKEILRTIPECNHYFHVSCIDEWLKLNATCPVCRNSPEGSATVTPFTSTSSSSSSSSLLSC